MTLIFLTWWNISIIHQSTTFLAQTCSHAQCWLVFVEKEDELSCQMTLGWWSLVHTTSSHVWKRHPPHALTEIYASILLPSHLILSFQSVLLISIILYICSITFFSHQKVLAMAASAAEVAWFICHMELTRKMRGGGICFYINEGWRTDVTVLGGKESALILRAFSQTVNGFIHGGSFAPLFWAMSSAHPHLRLGWPQNGHGAETSRFSARYSGELQCFKAQLQTSMIQTAS